METLIKAVDFSRSRNEDHAWFISDATKLVHGIPIASPKMQGLVDEFFKLSNNEEEAMAVFRKSENSEVVNDADAARISVVRGMIKQVASMTHFPVAEKRAAAERISIAFESYGLVASRLSGDKTVAIKNIIKDLQGTHAADAALIGLSDWLVELIAKQNEYEAAVAAGFSEKAQKSQLRVKEVRIEIDAVYRALIKHIEAVIEVHGIGEYENFVKELNVRIDKVNNLIAQRRGRNAKDDEGGATTQKA